MFSISLVEYCLAIVLLNRLFAGCLKKDLFYGTIIFFWEIFQAFPEFDFHIMKICMSKNNKIGS